MLKVFVDTVAWIALVNLSDALHARALRVMGVLRQDDAALVTTKFVFLEVADAFSAPIIHSRTIAFIEAFTSDQHFEQAGFVKLL